MIGCIVIVGATKTGKSSILKSGELLPDSPDTYIYDVEGEYEEYLREAEIIYSDEISIEEFIEFASNQKDSFIVFEEATRFFRKTKHSEAMEAILVSKRHDNNTIFLVFHSLNAIKSFIMDYVDLFIIKKTNDQKPTVVRKFGKSSSVYKAWERVMNHENRFHTEFIDYTDIDQNHFYIE